jgi:hypothetical protein
MAKVRAYVYKDTSGIDSYRVYPGVVILKKNDDFELVNLSGDPATYKMPAGPFGPASQDTVPNGQGNNKTVPGAAAAQAVEYVVEVKGKRAKGNSDPVIIIDL